MQNKKILLAACLMIYAGFTLSLGEYWYLSLIFAGMMVLGYFRAKHMAQWDAAEKQAKEKQE